MRHAVDVGEGVAFVTQTTGDQLGGGGHQLAREHLARLNQQQRLDLIFRDLEVTAQLHFADIVFFAFIHVDGDVDAFLVRRDRYLGRGDIHVDIAAIEVVGAQTLEVTRQFFTRVLVVVLEERQPVRGFEFEQVNQVGLREYRVAHHVDVLDRGNRAFVDVDLQGNAVTRLGHHFGVYRRRIAALGNILALQFVTHAFKGGTLEDFTFGQARLLQTFHQVISRDRLVAVNGDAGDGGAFDNRDNKHIAITTQLDILKETGFEQRTSGIHQTAVIRYFTHVQRQRAKHATGGNPLEAVDTDIRDSEGLGVNFGDHQYGENRS